MQHLTELDKLLQSHIPFRAVAYCLNLWNKYPFVLKITPGRNTKAGDFCFRKNQYCISVNRDLNPYLFLITLIHEIAHAVVYREMGNRCEPHGSEWKRTFRQLMEPLLVPEVFPEELIFQLQRHLQNPSASSFADADLTRCLRNYDVKPDGKALLADLPERTVFQLQGRWFIKGPARRTRFACRDMHNKKIYLVPGQALVSAVQQGLFS
ncbi:MAG: SprT-like domain-containing protein [Cyclobacteriaceae bacterium]|nr:SprT-like domain-containing protein [Cyclobacteriaceae bacterium]